MINPSATKVGTGPPTATKLNPAAWRKLVAQFEQPSLPRALWQLVNSVGLYGLLWVLMYHAAAWSLWLALALALLAGTVLVRVFIICHDCGHGSFFRSPRANTVVGFITGLLTFTPFHHWRWEHNLHHASAGHLDKRGTGDIWTLTVQEYLEASRWKRLAYRLARNPVVLFVVAPLFLFLVLQRLVSRKANPRERNSVHWMNLALLLWTAGMSWIFGLGTFLALQLVVLAVAGAFGVWLFYVQHQFEGVYWARGDDWDYVAAALQGSSFYHLPRLLQWFSGNIGYHHIHHLSPRIPNYNLERCHLSHPLFRDVPPITLMASLKSLTFRLWDEQQGKLVGFGRAREMSKARRKHSPPARPPD